MKKLYIIFLLFVFLTSALIAQSLVQTVSLPATTFFKYSYGLVYANSHYYISSDASTDGKGVIKAVDADGNLTNSIQINYPTISYSQGLTFDGTYFWYLERKTSKQKLLKVDVNGNVLDSITTPLANKYIGGAAWDGSGVWVSFYYPNNEAALYKIDVNTKTIVDTIPVFGTQPTGITVKGDTLFYVMDGFEGDPENIYAVSLTTKDTLFSFHVPENPGVRQNPRGLAWDGSFFWLVAEPLNSSSGRMLFKYNLGGSGSPGIDLLTTNINFGNVQIDSTSDALVQVLNYGTANLIIDSAYINKNSFVIDGSFPVVIKPDSMKSFVVHFTPASNISYDDSLLLYHNDPNFIYSKVRLQGAGVFTAPYIGLSSSQINFGNKRINSLSYEEIEISNYGSAPLVIDSCRVFSDNFSLDKIGFPIRVDSISSKSFRIWFSPHVYTALSDTFIIYSNASNSAAARVPLLGNVTAFDSSLGTKVWSGFVPENPNTNYNDLTIRALKGLDDINGDGVNDLVVSAENYYTVAFNGNSSGKADILWKFNTYLGSNNTGSVDYSWCLQTADLNSDEIKDVVIGTGGGNEFVYAIDGVTGGKLWEFGDSINYGSGDIMGLDVKRDRNGDGIPEVLVSQSGNENTGEGNFSVYMLDGSTGAQIWRIDQSGQKKLKYMVASNDIGGAFGTRVGSAYEVIGFDSLGNILWSFPTSNTPWTVYEINNVGGDLASDVVVGDIGGNVYVLSSDAGVLLWQKNIGNVFIEDMRVVSDINQSGTEDIFVSGIAPACYLLEGSTGDIIWNKNVAGNILGVGILKDITGDDLPEFGVADLNKEINIFEAKAGDQIFNYPFTGSGNAAELIESFGDVDGNASWEFAAASRLGEVVAFSGGTDVVIVGENTNAHLLPTEFELQQNYPNPFNPVTSISYTIPAQLKVKLTVYDILGRAVKTLVNDVKDRGRYEIQWDGTNSLNNKVSTGVYFYRLETDNFVSTKKLMLIK
ncbi:MAG: choice-of-anchor D domain-containing protein [Ignavibacteriaceae bacterium]|nr:choice-of-anchor D domain-containing protein [Ignavibacteriaceae bacterium]